MADLERHLTEAVTEVVSGVVKQAIQTALADLPEVLRAAIARTHSLEYLSSRQAADMAKVTPATIRAWVLAGRLTKYQAGRHLRIRADELHAFLRSSGEDDRVDEILKDL